MIEQSENTSNTSSNSNTETTCVSYSVAAFNSTSQEASPPPFYTLESAASAPFPTRILPFQIPMSHGGNTIPFFYSMPIGLIPAALPSPANNSKITILERNSANFVDKRVKMETNDISGQLQEFRDSLVNGLEENLQRLNVLDRLVSTVTSKGQLLLPLRPLLTELISLRTCINDLLKSQLESSVSFAAEIHSHFMPALKELLVKRDAVIVSNTAELPVEAQNLAEVAILLTKNKDLSREIGTLKTQLDSQKGVHETDLKTLETVQLHQQQFMQRLSDLLGVASADGVIDGISDLLGECDDFKERFTNARREFDALSQEFASLKDFDLSPPQEDLISLFCESLLTILAPFEAVTVPEANNFDALERRLDALIATQNILTHAALNNHLAWQSKHSSLAATNAQLQSQIAALTTETLHLQNTQNRQKSLISQLSADLEQSNQRAQTLQSTLSAKNQDFRAREIEILRLQGELEDAQEKHRHEIAALDRKIAALQMRLEGESRKPVSVTEDRFSGHVAEEKKSVMLQNMSIDEIPCTIPEKKKLFTFTGIRSDPRPLIDAINDLGASFTNGMTFSDDLTHVLAPPGYISIRVIGASLSGKWIVPPQWLEASHRAGHWLPEADHGGFMYSGPKPFRFKTIWMSPGFAAEHARHSVFQTEALKSLLQKIGKARFAESAEDAEMLLVTETEFDEFKRMNTKEVLTLKSLLSKIPINRAI